MRDEAEVLSEFQSSLGDTVKPCRKQTSNVLLDIPVEIQRGSRWTKCRGSYGRDLRPGNGMRALWKKIHALKTQNALGLRLGHAIIQRSGSEPMQRSH